MKSPKEIQKTKDRPLHPNVADAMGLENLLPILQEQFGEVVIEKQQADLQRNLASLKILELIVSGKIPQRPGEDYFTTTCRVIASVPSELKFSATTNRMLHKALADLKRADRWTTTLANIVEMRAWGTKRAVVRTVLLLTALERMIGSMELAKWLENPNPNLNQQAPVHFLRTGSWTVLADLIDDMLTGSPT